MMKLQTIPSYEIAEMMERKHGRVLEMIEGKANLIGIKDVLREHNFVFSDYFIEGTYKVEGNNKSYKYYECTKMGCELLANKLTGEKGILFTAKYVAKFNAMEQQLRPDFIIPSLKIWIEFDGRQHFEPVDFTSKWNEQQLQEQFKIVQQNDQIKNQYAKDNNWTLIRIPFTEYDNIEQILAEYIEQEQVI